MKIDAEKLGGCLSKTYRTSSETGNSEEIDCEEKPKPRFRLNREAFQTQHNLKEGLEMKIATDDFKTTNAAQQMVFGFDQEKPDYFDRHIGRAYLVADDEQEKILRTAFADLFGRYGACVVERSEGDA